MNIINIRPKYYCIVYRIKWSNDVYLYFADLNAARTLSKKVEEALSMLEAYNKRLSEEMEARKSVARMLHDYITYQKDLLAQAEETLEVKWLIDI